MAVRKQRTPRYLRESDEKQQTQPEKGKSVEIPVPTREDVLQDLAKVARPHEPKVRPG